MIGYVTVGTSDLQRSAKFYDALFAEINATRFMEAETFIAWSVAPEEPSFAISVPFNGEPATVGNGVMVALQLETPEQVEALYKKAIALGGVDEGPAGPRGDGGFYAGYFRDLDGNKLNFFCIN